MSDRSVKLLLDLIAAKAAMLAMRAEKNQFWPGDLAQGVMEISRLADEVLETTR